MKITRPRGKHSFTRGSDIRRGRLEFSGVEVMDGHNHIFKRLFGHDFKMERTLGWEFRGSGVWFRHC